MKKFDVCGRIYKHIRSNDLPEGVMGYCDPHARIIKTRKGLKGIELMDVVLHELDHASKFESGLHQTMDTTALEVSADMTARWLLDNFDLRFKPRPRIK